MKALATRTSSAYNITEETLDGALVTIGLSGGIRQSDFPILGKGKRGESIVQELEKRGLLQKVYLPLADTWCLTNEGEKRAQRLRLLNAYK